jgi:chorismate mutase
MALRGLRGATTVELDERQAILAATRRLLEELAKANPGLLAEDIARAITSLTPDLSAAFPAEAARQIGWSEVPLFCAQEIPVPGALPRCIRVLIHWNTGLAQAQIHPVYLGEARRLRPDLTGIQP